MPTPPNSHSVPLPCPELPADPSGDWIALDDIFSGAPLLEFRQHWRASAEALFQPGTVRLGWRGDSFFYLARLQDSHPHTTATARNQRLWLLGDVLELFAGIHGDPAYIECHTAPNGQLLQLLWPNADALAAANTIPTGITPYLRVDDRATFSITTTPSGWSVLGSIPARILSPTQGIHGSTWDINFGRYDRTPGLSSPILSATSPLTEPHFHRRAEWTTIRFA